MSDPKPSKSKGKASKANQSQTSNPSTSSSSKEHQQQQQPIQEDEPTKLDYTIAKYLRNNLPEKMAMFMNIKKVNYFIGSKAVDLLLESQYKDQFKSREEAVTFLDSLILKKFYHRARIVRVDGSKKKFKLDMHKDQIFEDSKEAYVWIYEPTSIKAWLLCIGLMLLIVALCLFPLWPPTIRTGVYYLCIGSLILLLSFLALSILRHIIYVILLGLTFGKIKFWLLPNLTEDVGFWESFVPLYSFESDEIGSSDGNSAPEGAGGDVDSYGLGSSIGAGSSAEKAGHQD